jgi:hypothetical protein
MSIEQPLMKRASTVAIALAALVKMFDVLNFDFMITPE